MKIMDKMAYQSSLNDILDKIIEDYKNLVYSAEHLDRLHFINVLMDFGERIGGRLDDIQKHVDKLVNYTSQLEEKSTDDNKIQTQQVVVRTYPFGKHPREYRTTNEDLKECLNRGYHVVMANKVIDGVIEYILQKEVVENER